MTRILVTGASGLLGLNFGLHFYRQHAITGLVNSHTLTGAPFETLAVDLTVPGEIDHVLEQVQPELIIHCAALANIDACEQRPEIAGRVNTWVPQQLARRAQRDHFRLVHLSTDAVFDGRKGDYNEEDTPHPLSVYAHTKWQAEQQVLEACPDALVARVNFYGWSLHGQRSLGEFFVNSLSRGSRVNGFTDVIFCPLEVTLLSEILLKLAKMDCNGLLHVVSSQCWSKYDFGVAIARQFNLDAGLIQPVSVQQGGLVAARSPNLRLRTDKLTHCLGALPPDQDEGIKRFFDQYQAGYPQRMRAFDPSNAQVM